MLDYYFPLASTIKPQMWVRGSSFGNALYPTDHIVEVFFSILVITCGLLLFTMLIGNIQVGSAFVETKNKLLT